MEPTILFTEIKEEILKRAKEAGACVDEYKRAYNSESFKELLEVVTDNFRFCCNNKVIDVPLLEKIGADICKENDLFYNESIEKGWLLVDSATVRAWGSATVEAWGSATVEAWDSATVRATDSVRVEAKGTATVNARDSATVRASGSATVRASGSASVRAWGSATVEAWGSATVRASGSATVEAWDSAYINSYNNIEHKLSDKAIVRYHNENRIVIADGVGDVERKKSTGG